MPENEEVHKSISQEELNAEPIEEPTPTLEGMAAFSIEDDDDEEEKKEVEDSAEESKEEAKEESKEEPKEEIKPEGSEEKKEPEFELKVPESTEESEEETSSTWKDIGEDLGLDIKGEDYGDFQEAYKNKIKAAEKAAYEKAKSEIQESPDAILDEIDSQTRELIRLAKGGADIASLMSPVNEVDKYLALDNETLIKEDLSGRESSPGTPLYTEEQIEAKLEKMQENDLVELEADKIREDLYAHKQQLAQDIINEQIELKEQREAEQLRAQEEQSKVFNESVDSIDEFMGGRVGDEAKAFVKKQWENGEVHKMFSDPKKVVEFMLYNTFGEQVLEQSKTASYNEGQSKSKQGLHNTPPITGGGSRIPESVQQPEAGDFSAWNDVAQELSQG